MKRIAALLLTAILAIYTPVAQAVVKVYKTTATEASALVSSFLPWLLPVAPTPQDAANPGLPAGEVFINGLLVLNSSVGLVQTTTSQNYRSGMAYDGRSYLRVTQAAPSGANFIRGIAVNGTGAVHIFDASAGIPANAFWQDGLAVTPSGQLCVVFG